MTQKIRSKINRIQKLRDEIRSLREEFQRSEWMKVARKRIDERNQFSGMFLALYNTGLTAQETFALKVVYENNDSRDLSELVKKFRRSKERCRQIREKAKRKLRHPKREMFWAHFPQSVLIP
ncbi:MAG: hypothetical protein D4R57_01180 [Verrucomicrobiales bacterium]|nr:MAG: hypothetical protein D4R57_01180 [Verrucomicrobiales bacterium]